MTITGTPDNDNLTGTSGNDTFDLTQGGDDTVHGLAGKDTFEFGATFTARDTVDGGDGADVVTLTGDYSAGVVLGASTLTSVETIGFGGGFDYSLTTNDANVAAGQTLTIDAFGIGRDHMLTFDGSAETDGHFDVLGNNVGLYLITGGQSDDVIDIHAKGSGLTPGNDFVDAGAGDDAVTVGGLNTPQIFAADGLNGGAGTDTLTINGEIELDMASMTAASLGFETLKSVGPSEIFGNSGANNFDFGGFTADSVAIVDGQGGNDTLTASKGQYFLKGGDGNDTLTAMHGKNITLHGDAGDDLVVALTNQGGFGGGTGTDTLDLDAGAARVGVSGFETIVLAGGSHYRYSFGADADTSTSVTTVDASALVAGNTLNFTGGSGMFHVIGSSRGDHLAGGAQDDVLSGNGGNDTFDLSRGGNDTVHGGDGNDTITLDNGPGGYTTADTLDGGANYDTVILDGDFSANGIHLGGNISNIERVMISTLQVGTTAVTTDDALVAAGETLTIDARGTRPLNSFDGLVFDGSAETDGRFIIWGTEKNDHIDDGAGNDVIHTGGGVPTQGFEVIVSHGGEDRYFGSGNDQFVMGAVLDRNDGIHGQGGDDAVILDGDYSTALHLKDTTIQDVTNLQFTAGHNYDLVMADGNVAEGATMKVDASALGAGDSLTFNGTAEKDGSFVITGGAGADALYGGGRADTIMGGDGGGTIYGGGDEDLLSGGAGADTFLYHAARESTGLGFDTIDGFDASMDAFHMPFKIKAVDAAITSGKLDIASFGTDLAHAADAAHLGIHAAVLFTATSGSYSGDTFLIVDANGVAGFQTGEDYVIRLTDGAGLNGLSTANFA